MKLMPVEKDNSNKCNYLYRYEDNYRQIRLCEFEVVRETNCGWWIKRWSWDNKDLKFVYKSGKNNFAKKTKKEALENYYHRKCRHVAILNSKLADTKELLEKARTLLEKDEDKSDRPLELFIN